MHKKTRTLQTTWGHMNSAKVGHRRLVVIDYSRLVNAIRECSNDVLVAGYGIRTGGRWESNRAHGISIILQDNNATVIVFEIKFTKNICIGNYFLNDGSLECDPISGIIYDCCNYNMRPASFTMYCLPVNVLCAIQRSLFNEQGTTIKTFFLQRTRCNTTLTDFCLTNFIIVSEETMHRTLDPTMRHRW